MIRRHSALLLLFILLAMPSLSSARIVGERPLEREQYAAGRVLVKFSEGMPDAFQRAVARGANSTIARRFPDVSRRSRGDLVLLRSNERTTEQLLAWFRAEPGVEYAEPDYLVFPLAAPGDTYYGQLWGLDNTGQSILGSTGTPGADISAETAWDNMIPTSSETVVMVIDTGVDYSHQDMAARMWVNTGEIPANGVDDDGNGYVDDVHGIDPLDDDNDPMSGGDHGTHVAGTIAAEGGNNRGVAGVSWDASWGTRIMACRFLGPGGGFVSDAIACLDYAAQMKARGVNIVAVNASWGGSGFSTALRDAIDPYCNNPGNDPDPADDILFVASAGNSAVDIDSNPSYPAAYTCENIISVAATTQRDALASFSNYGSNGVDVGAPGTLILSTIDGGGDYTPNAADPYFDDFESTGGGDTQAPSVPSNLAGQGVSTSAIGLSWSASSDNVGVAGYRVFRNGAAIGTTSTPGFTDSGLPAGTSFSYRVSAFDAAGNESAQSGSITVSTQSGTGGLTLSGPDPGIVGVDNTFSIVGANSGQKFQVFISGSLGSGSTSECPSGLGNPDKIGEIKTNSSGSGEKSMQLEISGGTWYFQGIDKDTCTATNILAHDFSATSSSIAAAGAGAGADDVELVGASAFGSWNGNGNWALVGENPFSGSAAWSDSPGDDYPNNYAAALTSSSVNLSGLSGELRIGFRADIDLENGYDYLYLEFSRDGGANWTTAAEITGASNGYRRYAYSVPVVYRTANFRVRFRIHTDSIVRADGVHIDDVGIGFGSGSGTYAYFSGTSMASPHVTGAAALLFASAPTLTAGEVKAALLSTVDPVSALAGRTVTGGRINAAAALASIAGAVDTQAPSTPANLAVDNATATRIDLAWNAAGDNVGVDHYRVYRDGSPHGTAAGTSFSDTGLAPSQSHAYRVSAVDAAGNESGLSNSVTGSTLDDTSSPSVPTGVSASAVSPTAINVSWSASSDDVAVDHYRVYRDNAMIATVTTTQYQDTGLSPSTGYVYEVAAVDTTGNVSARSVQAPASTEADDGRPTAPAGLTVSGATATRLDLDWQASTDNVGVDHYRIYRNGTFLTTTASTAFSDTVDSSLSEPATFTYVVTAVDGSGNVSDPSNEVGISRQWVIQ